VAEQLARAVAAVLEAAGERPAARKESGWTLTPDGGGVLVNYKAAGAGEAVLKRAALTRWLELLGTAGRGWTVTGRGSRKLAFVQVTDPRMAVDEHGNVKPAGEFTAAEKWWCDGGECDGLFSGPHVHCMMHVHRVDLITGKAVDREDSCD
jgi:hypothetical protein